MIELYTRNTPNGRKASIMLEELGAPYRVHPIDLSQGEQFKPDFLAISPNNKIPAIVDTEGPGGAPLAIFESGAILIYLARKYGALLPTDPVKESQTLQWLFWQVGGVGPMFGQAAHFAGLAEPIPYAQERYTREVERLLGVLDRRLAASAYLGCEEFTIADIATVTWVGALANFGAQELLQPYAHVRAWSQEVRARPGVQRGWDAVP